MKTLQSILIVVSLIGAAYFTFTQDHVRATHGFVLAIVLYIQRDGDSWKKSA